MPAIIISLLAVLIFVAPELSEALQWTSGDANPLTLWTAHLTHWSGGHLFWDVLILASFGLIAQRRFGLRVGRTFLLTAPLIMLGVSHWSPELISYRGLSGFDTLLFVYVCMKLLCDAKFVHAQRLTAAILLAGLTAKTAFEATTGGAIFVQDMGPGIVAAPMAHLIGGVLGAGISVWPLIIRRHDIVYTATFGCNNLDTPAE